MEQPTITPVRRSLVFRWPEGPIAKVMRIHQERGQFVAEVAIGLQELGQVLHLREAHFNLSSQPTRASWAKELQLRANTHDWHEIVEVLCVQSIRRFREGRPSVWLDEVQYPTRIPPRLAPLLYQRQPTVLFGDGATGKSTIALAIALAVSSGQHFLNWEPVPTKVLYLDWEADSQTMARRLEHLKRGMSIDSPTPIRYKRMNGLLSELIDQVAEEIAEFGYGLVIVDAMGKATANAPDGGSEALHFFDAMDSLETDYLVIDHLDKASIPKKDTDRPYGSTFKFTSARALWWAKKQGEPGENDLYVRLEQTKANDMTRHVPIPLHIRFDEDATYLDKATWDEMPEELQRRETQAEKVLKTLEGQPLSFHQLQEASGIGAGSLQKVLQRLKSKGQIGQDGELWQAV